MSYPHREGWPPSSGPPPMNLPRGGEQSPGRPQPAQPGSFSSSAPVHQQQPQSAAPVLPPPAGPFYPAAGPAGPSSSLPALGGMTHSSPPGSSHRPSLPPHEQPIGSQPHSQHVQGASYPLPGIHQGPAGQALSASQQASEREREREAQEARDRDARERDYEAQARREQQEREARERERDREMRDRPRDQPMSHQNPSEQLQLHQPVPQARPGIHGPNGLLANTAPPGNPGQVAGTPGSSHMPLFGPHYEGTPRGAPQQPPPVPPNAGPPGGNANMQQIPGPPGTHGQQPILNDALSYLDQVKVQFSGEPNVYNQFLDIMKDFKSQAIDTPGVIRRVSSLFAGNPNLIQGFNTFLPPGYRIECGSDGDPSGIRVTTPRGTTVSPMGTTLRPLSNPRVPAEAIGGVGMYEPSGRGAEGWEPSRRDAPEQIDGMMSPNVRPQEPRYIPGRSSPFDGDRARDQHMGGSGPLAGSQQDQRGVSQLQAATSGPVGEQGSRQGPGQSVSPTLQPAASNGLALAQQGALGGEKRGPVEFNHAISYVNKIKNRFAQQPEIYKQFLEILQTYQRESKPIQDVYAQVTHLFNDAPDLLQDFKQFLPESAAHAKAAAQRQAAAEEMTMVSNIRGGPEYPREAARHTPRPEQHRLPPVGNFAPTPSHSRDTKRKRGDRQGPVGGPAMGAPAPGPDFGAPSGTRTGFGPSKRTKQSQHPPHVVKPQTQVEAPAVSPTLVPALPEPMPPPTTTAASSEELNFFDRVKKYIGNKNTMNEFLKLCNLFSQDLIDKNLLVYRISTFIGDNNELFSWFKNFVNYDGKDQIIENRAKPESGRISLNNCRAYGPSYRLLPKRERLKLCSGRDELCNSVLNDEWASHPTWASEDSGFIAHRKNVHEEGLHRIEEERHDYDHHIAVGDRAIQLLEPLAQQNAMFSNEERERWKLPADLGGQSQSIFRRMLTKIYGRDAGLQVLVALTERPASVVPVLLMRCRHKVEEWKLSQREWEKIWRDQTQRMFWKSLDHQGISAKMADKRQFQTKTLQNEIQVKYEEQKRQKLSTHSAEPRCQAEWTFSDKDVLMDASYLLLTYAENAHSAEFPKLTQFIKDLIPLFFGLDSEAFQQRINNIFESSPPSNEEGDEETPASEDSSHSRSRRTNGKKADLLRDVLEKGRKSARNDKDESVASGSRATTPDVASTADEEMPDVVEAPEEVKPKTWVTHPIDGNIRKKRDIKPNEPFKRNVYNLYANLPIYCFFRVFVILYDRLYNLKISEREVHDTVRRAKMHKAAHDLRMLDKHPDNFFSDTSANANYYNQMLLMLEELLKQEGGMDMAHIEEVLRRYYLSNGWMLYSFDKMLGALVRFAIAILSNDGKERSNDILQLFTKDRKKEFTTHQDELTYRKQVEKYVKDGDVYRIAYAPVTTHCTVRILKKDESTFDTSAPPTSSGVHTDGVYTPEQRWAYYISSYTTLDPTEGVPREDVTRSFLNRNLRVAMKAAVAASSTGQESGGDGTEAEKDPGEARMEQLRNREGLGLRISPTNYKIYWSVIGSEEWWMAQTSPSAASKAKGKAGKGSAASGEEAAGVEAEVNKEAAEDAEGKAGEEDATNEAAKEGEGKTEGEDAEGQEKEASERGAQDAIDRKHEAEDRDAGFSEKFVMNNRWMAGLSTDAVDKVNKEYYAWKDGERNTAPAASITAAADEDATIAATVATEGATANSDVVMTE